jgi:hypothetical protein
MQKRLAFHILIAIIPVLFLPRVAFGKERTVGAWTMGAYALDAYDKTGNNVEAKSASTKELSNRGHPLIFEGCGVGRPNGGEARSSLMLFFIDGPDETFWRGKDALDSNGRRIVWFQIDPTNDATQRQAVLLEAGQDGYYFSINAFHFREAASGDRIFALCPARDSDLKECRRFSLMGLPAAVRFICNRNL